tara:strand:- start:24573 stop:25811 length:1239 start_codon:yes stop_codon:yes gene_type:complete
MKSLAQIRKTSEDVLLENADNTDIKKLTTLVRSGLFDPTKLMLLKRALAKENMKMTKAERQVLLDLLDKLLTLVTNDRQMFGRTRSLVREEAEDGEFEDIPINEVSALPAVGERGIGPGALARSLSNRRSGNRGNVKVGVDTNQIPALIVLKRRAIRVFPDGQKVALYWADRINKYISVPFQSIGISEDLDEGAAAEFGKSLIPGHDAYQSYKKGNYAGAAGNLALDAASLVGVGVAARVGIKGVSAGIKALRATRAARAVGKASKLRGAAKLGAAAAAGSAATSSDDKSPAEKTAAEKSTARSLKKDGPAFGGTKIKAYSAVRAKQQRDQKAKLDKLYSTPDEKPDKKDDISEEYITKAARFYNLNINSTSASKIFATYNSLNENNKVVFQEMINRNKESFTQVLNFTLKN